MAGRETAQFRNYPSFPFNFVFSTGYLSPDDLLHVCSAYDAVFSLQLAEDKLAGFARGATVARGGGGGSGGSRGGGRELVDIDLFCKFLEEDANKRW